MNIDDIYKRKAQVENEVNHLLHNFTELTGMHIESVSFQPWKNMLRMNNGSEGIKLNVRLWGKQDA